MSVTRYRTWRDQMVMVCSGLLALPFGLTLAIAPVPLFSRVAGICCAVTGGLCWGRFTRMGVDLRGEQVIVRRPLTNRQYDRADVVDVTSEMSGFKPVATLVVEGSPVVKTTLVQGVRVKCRSGYTKDIVSVLRADLGLGGDASRTESAVVPSGFGGQ